MHTIERRIEIDMGHRIPNHKSKCRNLHGHRYVIIAVVESDELVNQAGASDEGMVTDFGVLKDVMMMLIHDKFDHKFAMFTDDPMLPFLYHASPDYGVGVVEVPCVPTAENLSKMWFEGLEIYFSKYATLNFRLVEVRVHETPNCVARYNRTQYELTSLAGLVLRG